MERAQIIDRARRPLAIAPLDALAIGRGAVVGHRVILQGCRCARLAAAKLVPTIIGEAVAIQILHNPNNARLGGAFVAISTNSEVVALNIIDAMVEADNHISAKAAQRQKLSLAQATLGIGYGIGRSLFLAREASKLLISNILSRSRGIFHNATPRWR